MPDIRLRVDGATVFDGDAGQWEARPPDLFRDAIKPGAVVAPWLKAVAVAMAESLTGGRSVRINVRTKIGGWSMDVADA